MNARIGLAAAMLPLLAAGCTQRANYLTLQSKFAYPNGDYASLGHVHATSSQTTFLNAAEMDKAMFNKLEQDALKQKGGDVLVDYVVTTKITAIPLIPILFTDFEVDGTALRVTQVGMQKIDMPAPGTKYK